MSDDIAIRVEGLWKRYGLPLPKIYYKGRHWLRNRQPSASSNPQSDSRPYALRDINFEVRRGETLGIIGRNGAGKSTLLKVLAGVSPPTRGKVDMRGTVFPMIELNAGLHMELTGRENVRMLGAIMGFSRPEIEARMPEIEAFMELGEWFDRPVRMYSSGMQARLGFGVAMNVDADLLLFDEVLAVGDLAFQAKCYDRIGNLRHSDATILLVSHSIRQVQRLCERAILLEEGRILSEGPTDRVVSDYYRISHDHIAVQLFEKGRGATPHIFESTGQVRITDVTLLDGAGNDVDEVIYLKPLTIRLHFEVIKPVPIPRFAIGIQTPDMVNVTTMGTTFENMGNLELEPGLAFVDCTFDRLSVLPGLYSLRVVITSQNKLYKMDQMENVRYFRVTPDSENPTMGNEGGFFKLDANWSLGMPNVEPNQLES